MRNEELYRYLTAKCKERRLPIESLPGLLDFSRSSLYRYMTGTVRMSENVRRKFVTILGFDEAEQQEFERLAGLSEFDSGLVASRAALDDFVFCKKGYRAEYKPIRFAYHEKDVFLRTSDEIYELIQTLAAEPGVSCKVKIVNCLDSGVFQSVAAFLEGAFSSAANIAVEHLLTFSEKDYLHNTNTLIRIIPLLKHKCYSVCYVGADLSDTHNAFFRNTLIVDVQHKGDAPKYFFISYLDEELSACLATSDKNVFTFGMANYDSLKKHYDSALLAEFDVDPLNAKLLEMEANFNQCLLKPNPCYGRIPVNVLRGMVERSTPEVLEGVKKGFAGSSGLVMDTLDPALYIMEKRVAASYRKQHIDVYSKAGLLEFAETGRLTDHFDFLPLFTKQERRTILEYIRGRHLDPKDNYSIFITKDRLLEGGHIIVAYEDLGVLIEYSQEDYRQGICSNLFIKNKMLAEVFTDYAKNHVPENHALSREETTAFLNGLIEGLGG